MTSANAVFQAERYLLPCSSGIAEGGEGMSDWAPSITEWAPTADGYTRQGAGRACQGPWHGADSGGVAAKAGLIAGTLMNAEDGA
jgi:hypothetical protein